MIHIERGAAPDDFLRHTDKWWSEYRNEHPLPTTSEYWAKVRKRSKMRQYSMALFSVFHKKCAFCESAMSHVSAAHIDHYRPKGDKRFVHLMFQWDNWLISCGSCNTSKGGAFPECDDEPCLIDPSRDEPSNHIDFIRVQAVGKTRRGRETIDLLKLWRGELEDQRGVWLSMIDALLLLLRIPEVRADARLYLTWAIQESAPFTAMTRCYLSGISPGFVRKRHPVIPLDEPVRRIRSLVDRYRDELEELLY